MNDCNILILEDEALIAMDIEMTLAAAGHNHIAVTHTVDDALNQLAKATPSIALLDFNLGNGKTSVPVAERLREMDVPFILLSGNTDATVNLPDGLAGATRLSKPFQSAVLVAKVQSVLDGS